MKMKNLKIISIFILFIIIGSLIIFHFKYVAQFNFYKFMTKLEDKLSLKEKEKEIDYKTMEAILQAYYKVFNHYFDNAASLFALLTLLSMYVLFFTIIAILISVILQFGNKSKDCKFFFIMFFSIYSLANIIIYFILAFNSKYKLDLSEKDIYIFDDEFNQEIKNNLYFMFKRKIYLITFVFLAFIGIIAQLIIGIIVNKNKDSKIPDQSLIQPDNVNNEKQN